MSIAVKIENFEGPLDLLLHLIKKNEMDVYDIPIAEITSQYLAVLDAMKEFNLDVAGEFLLMAATLLQIKSRMLLPLSIEEEAEEEEADPRAELVRRLLEYQRYKEAAESLEELPRLGREVFVRPAAEGEGEQDEEGFAEVGLFDLVEALRQVLAERPAEPFHEVDRERLSVAERVQWLLDRLEGKKSLDFGELIGEAPDRHEVVVTFLAMLELVKLRSIRLLQSVRFGTIRIFGVAEAQGGPVKVGEEALGYQ